jgi:hypothetical protein
MRTISDNGDNTRAGLAIPRNYSEHDRQENVMRKIQLTENNRSLIPITPH